MKNGGCNDCHAPFGPLCDCMKPERTPGVGLLSAVLKLFSSNPRTAKMGERITDKVIGALLGPSLDKAEAQAAALSSPAPAAGGAEVVAWACWSDSGLHRLCADESAAKMQAHGRDWRVDGLVLQSDHARLLAEARAEVESARREANDYGDQRDEAIKHAAAMEAILRKLAGLAEGLDNANSSAEYAAAELAHKAAALLAPTTTDGEA